MCIKNKVNKLNCNLICNNNIRIKSQKCLKWSPDPLLRCCLLFLTFGSFVNLAFSHPLIISCMMRSWPGFGIYLSGFQASIGGPCSLTNIKFDMRSIRRWFLTEVHTKFIWLNPRSHSADEIGIQEQHLSNDWRSSGTRRPWLST